MRVVKSISKTKRHNIHDRCSSCNKKSYWSELEAERMRDYLISKGEATYLRVYKCPERMGFHLTSSYRY